MNSKWRIVKYFIDHSPLITRQASLITPHSTPITRHSLPAIPQSSPNIRHSSFITRHSLPVIPQSSPNIRHSSLITHPSSFLIHHSSPVTHPSSFIIRHSSLISLYSSLIIHYSSLPTHPLVVSDHESMFHLCPNNTLYRSIIATPMEVFRLSAVNRYSHFFYGKVCLRISPLIFFFYSLYFLHDSSVQLNMLL